MADEDRVLILGLKRGDMPSFQVLFEKYRRPVFAYVRGLIRDRGLAEDCVQEVFVELIKSADRIDAARGVKNWLFRVAHNRAVDMIRRQARETPEGADNIGFQGGASPDKQLMQKEGKAGLMNAIAGLKEDEREIVMLRFFGGLTFAEAEKISGVPLNTLIWRCRRALKKLEKRLAGSNLKGVSS